MAGSIHKYETTKGEKRFMVMLEVGDNGKRKQKKKMGFKTKTEARKYLAENEVALSNGTYIEATKMTYGEFIEEWFETKRPGLSITTVNAKRSNIDYWIKPQLGELPISSITPRQIQQFINLLKSNNMSPITIKKVIYPIVKSSLEHAVNLDMIPKNPAINTELPPIKKKEEFIWNEEQVSSFFTHAKNIKPSFYLAFYIAYYSGARQGEILGLPWKNVSFENNTITINQTLISDGKTISETTKNDSSRRTIGLPIFVMDVLRNHKKLIDEQKQQFGLGYSELDLVICDQIGRPLAPSDLRKKMKAIAAEAGIPHMKFHGWRHLHCSYLLSKGNNIKAISARLGHSSTAVTLEIYSHLTSNMEDQVISTIEELKID